MSETCTAGLPAMIEMCLPARREQADAIGVALRVNFHRAISPQCNGPGNGRDRIHRIDTIHGRDLNSDGEKKGARESDSRAPFART